MTNPDNCRHQNIHWDDLFKKDKDYSNKFYCLDCGETKGLMFAMASKKWYQQKIEKWLKDNGLAEKKVSQRGEEFWIFNDWIKFIEKNNYKEIWNDFCRGRIDSDNFEGFGGQMLLLEFADSIEYLLKEFKQEKQDTPSPNPNPRERERENKIKRLQKRITKLENKNNRTPQEEQELTDKRTELAQLTNTPSTQNNNPEWIKPALLIGGSLLVVGLVIYLISKNKKRE